MIETADFSVKFILVPVYYNIYTENCFIRETIQFIATYLYLKHIIK